LATGVGKQCIEQPVAETQRGQDGQEQEPEPDEDEKLFVEHVYQQDTLDGVMVDVGQFSDFIVAKGDAWEVS